MYNIEILKNKSNTLLINYNNKGLLLDTGYDENDTNNIIQYLKSNNIELEIVFVSHYHKDHIQGVSILKKVFPKVKFFSSEITKFIYENSWIENALYFNLVNMNNSIDVNFNILGNSFDFYEVKIDIFKSNGHCYGNLIFKIDDYLFCPDIIITNNNYLPFISNVSAYFEDIDLLKSLKDINTVILTHNLNTINLTSFYNALDDTKNTIDNYINNIKKLIGKHCSLETLIIKAIETNNRTKCFEISMTKEQYGYTLYVIKNILNYLENIKKIDLIYNEDRIIIQERN